MGQRLIEMSTPEAGVASINRTPHCAPGPSCLFSTGPASEGKYGAGGYRRSGKARNHLAMAAFGTQQLMQRSITAH